MILDRFECARGVAVVDERGYHTFDEARARARDVASHIAVGHGRRIGILASPGVDFVAAFYGVVMSGACAVVLSPLHPASESAFFCEDADVDLVLVTEDQRERARAFAGTRPLVTIGDPAGEPRPPSGAQKPNDPALMLYTSGTTGKPKGAVLTHRNLAVQQEILAESWGLGPSDVLLHALPLHHMHGLCIALLSCLGAGATVRMLPAFDAPRLWTEMSRATVFMAVPTMYKKLLDAFDAAAPQTRVAWEKGARALRLATSGSSALPVTLAERWRALTGRIPLERFGMTEIGVGLSNPLEGERRAGTVGLPLRTVETRVSDSGELQVKGPSVFREYFRRPEATERAFVDGWFLTGDTVARDERGYFKILGRTSVDILKSGGYKLSALEIEEALREHEAVSDVAVVGVPDETWGERVVACVVVRPGKVLDPEMLRAFAKERLASYKCPKDVVTMQELPRNAMGKVQKPALIATLLALLACGSPGELGTSASPIVSGMADDGADTSVVAIFVNSGAQNGVVCSGTVVSPHVVLTAAHCLDEALVGPISSVQIFLGTNFLDPAQANNVAPAASWSYDTGFNPTNPTTGHDVGVVIAEGALTLAPMALNHDGLGSGDVGTPVHAVGFGQSDGSSPASAGPRRFLDTTIFGVDGQHLMLDDVICEGDSGGPTFMTKNGTTVIAGIHSFTTTMNCIGPGDDTRVDVYVSSFIDPAIQKADPGFLPSGGCSETPVGGGSPAVISGAVALFSRWRRRKHQW